MKRRKPKEQTPKSKKRRWLRGTVGILAVLVLLVGVDYYAFPYGRSVATENVNTGENGLWLRYKWYFGEWGASERRDLARKLQDRQIRYAYFHVRSIERDGSLKYRYPDKARSLLADLRRDAPDVKLIAWIYAGNKRGMGEVELSNGNVRRKMVEEAVWLMTACGFDGVQWDYEICPDNDPHFLKLMQETRAAMPAGKRLSTATPMWLPAPLGRFGWSETYFAQIAATCDQIAVMCYDSGFYLPRSYVWLVRQQAVHVTRAVARGNPNCRVLLGVPTYGPGLLSHNPRAENLAFALRGVREGLQDGRTNRAVFAGVAPFADYTTDAAEWKTYRALWLGKTF
jgi:hypothetical protein